MDLEEQLKEIQKQMCLCIDNNDKESFWKLHSLKVEIKNKILINKLIINSIK